MAQKRSVGLLAATVLLTGFGIAGAQTQVAQPSGQTPSGQNPAVQIPTAAGPPNRLAGDWRSTPLVELPFAKLPANLAPLDQGAALANENLGRMILLLAPSAAQKRSLSAELSNLEDPPSSIYHHWLTPQEYASVFANSSSDVAAIVAWLESQGFQVAPLPDSRGWIEFSGTVAQAEQAFHAPIHTVARADGSTRAMLAGAISVPGALQPLIAGLVSLDGVLSTPDLAQPQSLTVSAADLAAVTSPSGAVALTPQLAAQILDLPSPAGANAGNHLNGTGQAIAIAARSSVNSVDVAAFRAAFDLAPSSLGVHLDGADPGLTDGQAEATFAASWAGAAAPGARIVLVPSASTSATDGVDLSLAAIVDNRLATVAVVGYSACEAGMSPAHRAFYSALYQQAAAEGISMIAAVGDSGASACFAAGSGAPVSTGYGVNALASTPWNTAVGVAAFGQSGPAPGPESGPESGPASGPAASALAAWSPANAADPAYAGGGGSSTLYAEPNWQPVPLSLPAQIRASGVFTRLLPDLSLPTAIDTVVNPGLAFCLSSAAPSTGCTLVRTGGSAAAASLLAGLAALVDQKYGAQGNLAPNFYKLSTRAGAFNDVAQGSAQLQCAAGSPGCDSAGKIGFAAAPGFDLATGLGVPDAKTLIADWASPEGSGTASASVSVIASPTQPNSTYNPSASITFSVNVLSELGGPVPTGSVTFFNSTNLYTSPPVTLDSSGNASVALEGIYALGGNTIAAEYSGDSYYAASDSLPINLNIQPSTTSLVVSPSTNTVTPGQSISVTVTLTAGTPPAGTVEPAGVVTLNLDGGQEAYTASLQTAAGITTAAFPAVVIPVGTSLSTHTLQAVYSGNTDYSGSTSPQISLTENKGSSSITITPSSFTPTAGGSMTVTATITSSNGPSGAQPSGTVTVTVDGTGGVTVPVVAGSPSTAVVTIPLIASGPHILQATYSGDVFYTSSTSPTVSIVAVNGTTVTTITATPPILTAGVAETLTATIVPSSPVSGTVYTIGGTVSFYDGSKLLGQAPVTGNMATLAGVTLANNISHAISAVYSGDINWLGSTSAVLPLTATSLPDAVVLTANVSTAQPGQALVLTATVTPSATPPATGEQNPTGTVLFYNGTTVIGEALLTPVAVSHASTATLTTEALPGGQDTISAYYEGDLYFDAASSNPIILTAESFIITPAPSNPAGNLNIVQGNAGTVSYTITGEGGFNSEVQIECAVPAQDNMTCTATPLQQFVTPSMVNFVIQTFTGAVTSSAIAPREPRPPLWRQAAGGAALAGLFFFLLPFGKRARTLLRQAPRCSLIFLLLLVGLGASGIGCGSTSALAAYGTPLGVATLKITASAYIDNTVVSQSIYLTVNVLAPGSTP